MVVQERNLRQLQLPDQLRLPVQSSQHQWLLSVGLYRPHRRRPFQRYAARGPELGGSLQVAWRNQGWKWQTPDRYRRASRTDGVRVTAVSANRRSPGTASPSREASRVPLASDCRDRRPAAGTQASSAPPSAECAPWLP